MATNPAKVTVTGTPENPVFNFELPSGAKGERGLQGDRGAVGPTPQLKMGQVNTLANPSDAEWIAGMIRKSSVVTAALSETFPSTMKGDKGDVGGWNVGTGLGDRNLNDITAPGLYHQADGAKGLASLNYPRDKAAGAMQVYSWNGGVFQEFTMIGVTPVPATSGKYIRSTRGSVWTNWSFYPIQRTDNTAGRAFYTWDDTANREQLIYGDTGWRDVPLSNGYVGNLYFRRVGYEVFVRGIIAKPEAATTIVGEFLTAIPSGFESETGAWIYYPVRGASSSLWFTLYRKGATLSFDSTNVDVGQSRFEVSWSTTKPWPTTLPGIAVSGALGIIPNL